VARGQFLPPSAWVITGVVEWRYLLFGLDIYILSALDCASNFPDFSLAAMQMAVVVIM
jgi:hypothetical protein